MNASFTMNTTSELPRPPRNRTSSSELDTLSSSLSSAKAKKRDYHHHHHRQPHTTTTITISPEEVLQVRRGLVISKTLTLDKNVVVRPDELYHQLARECFKEETVSEIIIPKNENDVVSRAVEDHRRGKFPFFVNGTNPEPTPLDIITLHPSILSLATDCLLRNDDRPEAAHVEKKVVQEEEEERASSTTTATISCPKSHPLGGGCDDDDGSNSMMKTINKDDCPLSSSDDNTEEIPIMYPRLMDSRMVSAVSASDDYDPTGSTRRLVNMFHFNPTPHYDSNEEDGNGDDEQPPPVDAIVIVVFFTKSNNKEEECHNDREEDEDNLCCSNEDWKKGRNNNASVDVTLEISRLDVAPTNVISGSTNNGALSQQCHNNNEQQVSSAAAVVALRLIYRRSDAIHLECGDSPMIRHFEKARSWISSMSSRQRSSIGFPPPGHSYWDDDNALEQVTKRYSSKKGEEGSSSTDSTGGRSSSFVFDPSPYRNCRYMKKKKARTINDGTSLELSVVPPPPPNGIKSNHPEYTFRDPYRLIHPEKWLGDSNRGPNNNNNRLSTEQVRQFRDDGYLFIDDIFPQHIIDDAAAAAMDLWPDNFQQQTLVGRAKTKNRRTNHHSNITVRDFSFPFKDTRLNTITLHTNILSVVSQLLNVEKKDVRITQSVCVAKRGSSPLQPPSSSSNNEETEKEREKKKAVVDDDDVTTTWTDGNQPMHLDFGSNTLLTPARSKYQWSDDVEEVQGILYYDNHEGIGGGTSVVPGLQHTGVDPSYLGWIPFSYESNNPEDPRRALYNTERRMAYKRGSILLFQLGTWHRGTPVLQGGIRRVHHLCFRRADASWVGGWSEFGQPTIQSFRSLEVETGGNFKLDEFVNSLDSDQRQVLGYFPPTKRRTKNRNNKK